LNQEANDFLANFSAFEIDDEALANLREYALSNSLYWALAEGHACEQSARRNAMDVCQALGYDGYHLLTMFRTPLRMLET
jgi:F0F1-type ATP synthase gamma subunit